MTRILPRLIYVLVGVALLATIVWGFLPKPVPVDIATVTRGTLRVTVDEDGKTRIKEKYVVSSPLAGRLMRIDLHAGDILQSGKTLLVRIEATDPAMLDARVQAEAEARLRAAEATLKQTEPTLQRTLAAIELAKSEFGHAQQLAARNAVSQEELDGKKTQYRVSQEDYKAAKFGQDIAKFELALARAALLRTNPESDAEDNDPHFDIHSPINGRVLRVLQESATIVQPGMPLLEIGDPLNLEVEIDVLSADAVKIKPGARVSLEHWGGDRLLAGVVRVVEPSAFTKVSALGVEEQRVNVIVDLAEPPEKRKTLGDGFRVDARITVWEGHDVLKVPTGALFRHGDDWAVFVVRQGHAELRTVQLGHRSDLEGEVLDGLTAGETIILHPSDRIQHLVRVKPR